MVRSVFARVIFGFAYTVTSFGAALAVSPDAPGLAYGDVRDFVAYWSAASLLLAGENPYSPDLLLELQRSVGLTEASPLIMWNPPWTLFFVWPLGLLDFPTGQLAWLTLNVLLAMVAAQCLLRLYGNADESPWAAWVMTFTFVPAIYSLVLGQITPVILFALSMFLLLENYQKRFGLGLVLVLLSIKPHFIALFWLAVILWFLHRPDWRLLVSAVVIGMTAVIFPLFFDAQIYWHYLAAFQSPGQLTPLELPVPSLRNLLIYLLPIEGTPIEYLPTIAGVGWLLVYWRRHRQVWNWPEQLPLIVTVSIVVSPYSWTYDHLILLPAIIQCYGWLQDRARRLIVLYVAFNAVYLAARYVVPVDFWYFWMAPLFLALYIRVRNVHQKSSVPLCAMNP